MCIRDSYCCHRPQNRGDVRNYSDTVSSNLTFRTSRRRYAPLPSWGWLGWSVAVDGNAESVEELAAEQGLDAYGVVQEDGIGLLDGLEQVPPTCEVGLVAVGGEHLGVRPERPGRFPRCSCAGCA